MGLLKACELCKNYLNCKIYDKVCEEIDFLKTFLKIKRTNEVAKYCNSFDFEIEMKKKNKEMKELKYFKPLPKETISRIDTHVAECIECENEYILDDLSRKIVRENLSLLNCPKCGSNVFIIKKKSRAMGTFLILNKRD